MKLLRANLGDTACYVKAQQKRNVTWTSHMTHELLALEIVGGISGMFENKLKPAVRDVFVVCASPSRG